MLPTSISEYLVVLFWQMSGKGFCSTFPDERRTAIVETNAFIQHQQLHHHLTKVNSCIVPSIFIRGKLLPHYSFLQLPALNRTTDILSELASHSGLLMQSTLLYSVGRQLSIQISHFSQITNKSSLKLRDLSTGPPTYLAQNRVKLLALFALTTCGLSKG